MKRAFVKSWGAELVEGGTRFRLWAPGQERLLVRCRGGDHPMQATGAGWFELVLPAADAGDDYAFVLENGQAVPDPAARAQAGDVHGPSRITDPRAFDWSPWAGRDWEEAVIYEMHIGTFTAEGTFRAAIDKLAHLAATGITMLEIMPVAQFAGNRGWGYDGVLLYAPHPAYGTPDDFKALIDAAHQQGLMVVLDVVYNHFGPEGSYLADYAPDFFDHDSKTPWGDAIAYGRDPVRRFIIENALYWMDEFHLDGLRLDAVDHMRDTTTPGILAEIALNLRERFPQAHLTTEDDRNITHLHRRDENGFPRLYTAEWNDDFHNVAHVIATGETEGYYADFVKDKWAKFARGLAEGFIWQGERSPYMKARRGEASVHLPPTAFVNFLQNHDQTGNRAFGERLLALADPGMVRALMAIHLLSPQIPLMFMGEEWGETRPFCFFTDFHGDLAEAVRKGRRHWFAGFSAFTDATQRNTIPDPNDLSTFEASRIDWAQCGSEAGRGWLEFTRDLLALRRAHIVAHLKGAGGHGGQVVLAQDGLIAVDWQLNGAMLRLRANLSEAGAAALPAALPLAGGKCILGAPGPLPRLGVAFWLEAA